MGFIFRKCHSVFESSGLKRPSHSAYDKDLDRLIRFRQTEEHQQRKASVASARAVEKSRGQQVEELDHASPEYNAETGIAKNQ